MFAVFRSRPVSLQLAFPHMYQMAYATENLRQKTILTPEIISAVEKYISYACLDRFVSEET